MAAGVGERSAEGAEREPENNMLALHRSLTSSLYKSRLQASHNIWSCIIVTVSALVRACSMPNAINLI